MPGSRFGPSAYLSQAACISSAASTQNQALAALLFLYGVVLQIKLDGLDRLVRAWRTRHLPVVMSRDELRAVLASMEGVPTSPVRVLRVQSGVKRVSDVIGILLG